MLADDSYHVQKICPPKNAVLVNRPVNPPVYPPVAAPHFPPGTPPIFAFPPVLVNKPLPNFQPAQPGFTIIDVTICWSKNLS